MEGKGGEIRNGAYPLAVIFCAERMRGIRQNKDTPNGLLKCVRRAKQRPFPLHDLINPVIITGNTAEVHRHNRLSFFRDCSFQPVIVHLKRILCRVHHHQLSTHMAHHTGGGSISVSAGDDLITRAYAKQAQRHLRGRGRRI